MRGVVAASALAGLATACTGAGAGAGADLRVVAAAIADTMRAHLYDPALTEEPAYAAIERQVRGLAVSAGSAEAFVAGFNALWSEGPFSHVSLQAADADAATTAEFLDRMRVGDHGASLSWEGDVAVLTVTTMMGLDTIERIDAAYDEIAARGARALIIDLRDNSGGAFAVWPLVGHVIEAPLDAGVFLSRHWVAARRGAPTREDAKDVAPWDGWSIRAFWRDAQRDPLTRVQFAPLAPAFRGPVYVLIGARTASAAELAADALRAAGATLIGEPTAGRMLSQKMYDLPHGLQLSIPIADYHAFRSGRIEGAGIAPDVHVPPEAALEAALQRTRGN